VVNWFKRGSKRTEVPRIRARTADLGARKVDLAELTPPLLHFLGQASYLQLTLFENLSKAVANAPTTDSKENLSRVASLSLAKHHALTAQIERHGNPPGAVMEPFTAAIDTFQRSTQGSDWFETVLVCYLTAGFLDDFYVRLAAGLPGDYAERVTTALEADAGSDRLADELRRGIEANPRLASRLAMWGRRLVGDTMLVARAGLAASANHDSDEARIEPVFTELIAAHTRRMDALGLTA